MIEFKPADVRAFIDKGEVPHAITCVIGLNLVCRPVHARDTPQHVYEGDALRTWVGQSAKDPLTRAPLCERDILPAPQAHAAAQRFRRLVGVECHRRMQAPELSPESARGYAWLAALQAIARHRYAALPVQAAAPASRRWLGDAAIRQWHRELELAEQDFQIASRLPLGRVGGNRRGALVRAANFANLVRHAPGSETWA